MQKFYPYLKAQTDEARAAGRRDFDAALGAMADALRARGGPFLLGARPSLADTSVFPFIRRAEVVLTHYRGWAMPEGERFAPLATWLAAMNALPGVKKTVDAVDPKVFIDGYAGYAAGV
jgi:glutathione S-transferase